MHIKTVLAELGVQPSKRRGQNFLIEPSSARRIAQCSAVSADAAVLEIGPGLGLLTRALLEITNNLAVVEIEKAFCGYLERELPALQPQRIFCQDALELSAAKVAEELGAPMFHVVSNVPYSISSDIILWVLNNRRYLSSASLLLQKEFAERIAAGPGSRTYGSLSVLRALHADAVLGPVISGSSFHPRANVDSIVIKMVFRPSDVTVQDEALFEKVVRAAFGQRRKTIVNSLFGARLCESKEEIGRLLESAGIDPACRAETLSVKEFAALTERFQRRLSDEHP